MFKARSAYLAMLVCGAFAAFAAPASAQVAPLTVDQTCIDPANPAVSGDFAPVPTGGPWPSSPSGTRYDPLGHVIASPGPGEIQQPYGSQEFTDLTVGGEFSFNLAVSGSALPDTVWIKLMVVDYAQQKRIGFAEVPIAVCGRNEPITLDQTCIDLSNPTVSGEFAPVPTGGSWPTSPSGTRYDPQGYVAVSPNPGGNGNQTFYGTQLFTDMTGGGEFSFNLAGFGSALPDTVWVKLLVIDYSLGDWFSFAEVEIDVCAREPQPEPDTDGDGVLDTADNGPSVVNAGQENNDADAQGDACDADDDDDGVNDGGDNCQLTSNAGQENNDGDAEGDVCDADDENDGVNDDVDNCQLTSNPTQANNDLDAQGDACDADDDNDGVNDGGDNCQFTANPGQRDDDQDGIGNACDGTFDSNDGKSSGGGWLTTSDGEVNFSSSAKRVDGVMAGNCVVTVDQTKIKCLTVDGYYQSATTNRAVFVGSATQDGVTTRYRIELTDNGEAGTSDRIEITTDAGFEAAGVIGGGNLQVHRGV